MSGPRRRRILNKLGFSPSKSRENITLDTRTSSQPLLETRALTTGLAATAGIAQTTFSPQSLWEDIYNRELATAESDELKAAARRIREDVAKEKLAFHGVPSDTSSELKICQGVLQAAQRKPAGCKNKKWKIPGRGDVELSHVYGSVAESVQKFVSVGDVGSQIDPLHFGVPWAAVRLALLVSRRAARLCRTSSNSTIANHK